MRSALMREQTARLSRCLVPDQQTPHGTGRETQSICGAVRARSHRSFAAEYCTNDEFASLSLAPRRLIQGTLTLKSVIQVRRCKARQSAQLSDRNLTKLPGTGISNPGSIA
jgi:hypothetical protein